VEETLRTLVAVALTFLLVLHRLEAQRSGTAEYDEPAFGQVRLSRQLAWYAVGIVGILLVANVHPNPADGLFLGVGDRLGAISLGIILGVAGAAQALGLAWSRYGHLRLPDPRDYPMAMVNEVVTAYLDEAVFRGALLGIMVAAGLEPYLAILLGAMVYALATRLGAPGRSRSLFLLAIAVGLVGGWATVTTGGIAASFIGHAATRVAVFLTTGHAGQPAERGREAEDVARRRRVPEGWRMVRTREGGRGRS
jgi:hypothetical protein